MPARKGKHREADAILRDLAHIMCSADGQALDQHAAELKAAGAVVVRTPVAMEALRAAVRQQARASEDKPPP